MAQLPFDPSTLSPADRALYERMVERRKAQGAGFGGPYAALMNHPQLCERIEDLGYYLKFEGHLPRDIYQFVVLYVARHTGAAFEWIDHIQHAEAAGVPSTLIGALQRGEDVNAVAAPPYDLVVQALDSTLSWRNIPSRVQDEAIRAFGLQGFVELVVLSGFYQMFSGINEGFDVALPEGVESPFK
ncbi:MAG: carboxymuconolactone decarboxylase [Methylocystis sp.]|uniref:carboxymuconolactone decarboxylase n=1 Tax=Methylocystis sp. TaxID=1911079 RepID=UPI003941ABEB